MQETNFTINPYIDEYREQILAIWERSVLATHDFLNSNDFEEIKQFVHKLNFDDLQIFCIAEEKLVLGYIAVAEKKVEMLFVDPKYFGKGLGKRLLNFAISELDADQLDVNEQNAKALRFYQKFGFEKFQRTEKDDQGRNYPLLRMKLAKT